MAFGEAISQTRSLDFGAALQITISILKEGGGGEILNPSCFPALVEKALLGHIADSFVRCSSSGSRNGSCSFLSFFLSFF